MLDSLQPHHGLYIVHGILQARILEWVFLQWIFPVPGIQTGSPALQADSLPTEVSGKHIKKQRHCLVNKVHKVKASRV